jgi:hypothetical protein
MSPLFSHGAGTWLSDNDTPGSQKLVFCSESIDLCTSSTFAEIVGIIHAS